jgi:hypothetical protein
VYHNRFLSDGICSWGENFHTVCRTRQFFSVCRTICFFGIFWTNLNQSTFHTPLFRVCPITELQFGIAHCLLIYLLFFSRRKFLWIERCFHTWNQSVYLALHTFTLYDEKYKPWRCSMCNVFCILFAFVNKPKLLPSNFFHTFSTGILTIEVQSDIYSGRWSVTSDTCTLDLSTYLRHQSFNL